MTLNEREALVAQIEEFKKDAMELWFVPELAASYKNMDMFSYSIVKNNEVFFMREQARQLWKFWKKAKAQAVPEWISIEDRIPEEGQKCLVVFEVQYSKDDCHRFMEIDVFNDGNFDSIVNYEDQAASVALPDCSSISRLKAVCWSATTLTNKPLTFDQFCKVKASESGAEG